VFTESNTNTQCKSDPNIDSYSYTDLHGNAYADSYAEIYSVA